MKKSSTFFCTAMLLFLVQHASSQSSKTVITENFDGSSITLTASPGAAWKKDAAYFVSLPYAYRGRVPNLPGDSVLLQTPAYDFTGMNYIGLRFFHICKISRSDNLRLEYRIPGQVWATVPYWTYLGRSVNYAAASGGFSAASYPVDWLPNDSLALPVPSWWKEEVFDLSDLVSGESSVEFRFVLKRGTTPGTQIAYGWLIDNLEIIASTSLLNPPTVEFVSSYPQDTVYSTGPYVINAKVKSNSNAQIENPWLVYTTIYQGVSVTDSVKMQSVAGDSLWRDTLPQFVSGTTVVYSITGRDTVGNAATIVSGYVIAIPVHDFGNHSIALTTINSPVKGQTLGNVATPIHVTIRNKGDSVLQNATIQWSINNGQIYAYNWTGNLPWDFQEDVPIGTYTPTLDAFDTLHIWVSMPNGMQDSVLSDDTLAIVTFGCQEYMNGQYTLGTNGYFASIDEALEVFNKCLPTGDIILQLENGTYDENWTFTDISDFMGTYSLTITSLTGNKDSVILRPPSGAGISLSNATNLTIENITIDAASSATYGISFMNACSDIVITNCIILTDTQSTTAYPIYKPLNTGIADNISITYNRIEGGYTGIWFYGGRDNTFHCSMRIENNTLSKQSSYGIYGVYTDFSAVSNNRITSRIAYTAAVWQGIRLTYCDGNVTCNRIQQLSTEITQPNGINVQYFNYPNYANTNDTALIANNEIILYTTGTFSGINANTASKAKILHNSIYITGTGAARGINIVNNVNNYLIIKNNNISMGNVNAYPVYLDAATNLNLYDIDYNNLYAQTYAGYAGGNKTSIADWQQTITTDQH